MAFTPEFKQEWLEEIHVNENTTINQAKNFEEPLNSVWKALEPLFLLKAITFIDLTTLSGDDTISNVSALVNKALHPLPANLVNNYINSLASRIEKLKSSEIGLNCQSTVHYTKLDNAKFLIKITENIDETCSGFADLSYESLVHLRKLLNSLGLMEGDVRENLESFLSLRNNITVSAIAKNGEKTVRTAAVCVYPSFVKEVNHLLQSKGLNRSPTNFNSEDRFPIAAVAAGFPAGLYHIDSKIDEIDYAINDGASEIDIVISRYLVLGHRWSELFDEIRSLKSACKTVKLKTILAVGECGTLENVYKASMVAMMAGSDYIKTSTGKETVNATFSTGLIMCRAIKNFYIKTDKRVGFKPAGGIRTANDALKWMKLIVENLGAEWFSLFRIGASGVLDNIVKRLEELNQSEN